MPNYCNNQATFNHASSYRIEQVLNAANSNTLFNTFVPINNNDADHDDNLDPRDVWGCKWEASEIVVMNKSDDSITLYFDTPWAPPIAFYEAMEELGFTVEAYYWEPGMNFCGEFVDGNDFEYHVERNYVPPQIDAVFNIEEQLEEWYVDNMEEVERFVYEGSKILEEQNG